MTGAGAVRHAAARFFFQPPHGVVRRAGREQPDGALEGMGGTGDGTGLTGRHGGPERGAQRWQIGQEHCDGLVDQLPVVPERVE